MRLVMSIMKDNFCWLCERNTFPCAVFENGSKYKVNALFEQLSSDANLHRQIVSLVNQSQNNLGVALNMHIDVCNIWQNLTALSLEQNRSVYTVVFIEPNPSLVKHATTFLQAASVSPILIVDKGLQILFCNKTQFGQLAHTHPEQWEKIKQMIQKALREGANVEDYLIISERSYRLTVVPEYDEIVLFFKDITDQKTAEERYDQLKVFGLRFSLMERMMTALTQETVDLHKLGKLIYEEVRNVVSIDTFYLALVQGDCIIIEYGMSHENEITGMKIARGYSGFSNYVIDKGEFVYIPNSKTVHLKPYRPKAITPGETRYVWSYVGVPLKIEGKTVGAVSFQRRGANAFLESHLAFFEFIGKQITIAIKIKTLFDELEKQRIRYKEIAMKDSLTGCYTRYYFAEYFERFRGIIERKGGQISFVMIDINNFKQINDKYGHIVGDVVLREVGQLLLKSVRTMDLVVRFGGDEFLLMLPYVDIKGVNQVVHRISKKVAELRIPQINEVVTFSFGISLFDGSQSLEEVLKIADENMYKMKKGARV